MGCGKLFAGWQQCKNCPTMWPKGVLKQTGLCPDCSVNLELKE